ncbi:MAG: TonB family protein [Paludibacter sp.]|nr:TonB family protein [Paludibacter sp.]
MKNHKKTSPATKYRFLHIVPMALALVLSVNGQDLKSMTKAVTPTVRDSVTTVTKSVQTQTGSSIQRPNPSLQQPDKEGNYMIVDKMPQYPGGEKALMYYIGRHLKYPVITQKKGIQGKLIVRFVVNKSGKVENAKIIQGLEENADAEGLRVVNSLPDWIPGEQKGEKVSVYYTLPIAYKIIDELKTTAFGPKKKLLEVFDGKVIPIGNNLSSTQKDSILYIDVLKADTEVKKAELIAKYGPQAANGVILITKKK